MDADVLAGGVGIHQNKVDAIGAKSGVKGCDRIGDPQLLCRAHGAVITYPDDSRHELSLVDSSVYRTAEGAAGLQVGTGVPAEPNLIGNDGLAKGAITTNVYLGGLRVDYA